MNLSHKNAMAFKLSCCTLGMLLIPSAFAQTVSGVVVDKQGNPIANSEVVLSHVNKKTLTNEKGVFEIRDVDAGDHEVHVGAKNFSHFSQHVVVKENDISGLTFTLNKSVMENIDVFATPLHSSYIESALPINVLSSDELRLKQSSTLGDTLKGELGVHSTYFGPVASSPIIRGLDGPRVMVTQNGLDVSDASRVGPDHVVATDTSTATQIEVLRGPATLFYGSGAIGGVVNVVDSRIPTNSDTQVDYMAKHNDVSDEKEFSFNINSGLDTKNGTGVAMHFDAFYRDSNDYHIPEQHHEEEHDEHDDDHDDDHDLDGHDDHEHEEHEELASGKIDNSGSTAYGYTAGLSYLLDNGYIGLSYGYLDRQYGLPGHAHHEEEHDDHDDADHDDLDHDDMEDAHHEEDVYADLKQDRFQLLSDLTFQHDFVHRVMSKFSYTDYSHQEIEDGEVGTTFNNQMVEARFDIYHQAFNEWKGAFTLHYKKSDFEAIGDEAFTPPSSTNMLALAWLEEKHFDDVLVQLGARVEKIEISAHDVEHNIKYDESFTPVSASVGTVWNFSQGYNLGVSVSYAQRAPSAAEVLSNGPHIGTNTYEVGAYYQVNPLKHSVERASTNPGLETSFSTDVTFRKFEGDFGVVLSAFYNQVDDYYYQQDSGYTTEVFESEEDHLLHADDEHAHEDELPVFLYRQDDVNLYGFESELIYQVAPNVKAKLFGDYIRAKLKDGGNLPRIPPLRVGSEFSYTGDNFAASLTAQRYFNQNKVSASETTTDGYTMVDAHVNYYVDGIGNDFVVFLKAENILDNDARVHSSFLKDVTPLPARAFSVGVRGSF